MAKTMPQETFSKDLLTLWEETFTITRGAYLDRGTSLLTTLDQISAEEASIPVGNGCASIAAQVEHVILYLVVVERSLVGRPGEGQPDWGDVWRRVGGVTSAEWDEIRARLRATYERIDKVLRGIENWQDNDAVGDSMAMVVHTAYHLGEIRQALCTVGHGKR